VSPSIPFLPRAAAQLAALDLDEKAEAEYFKLEHRLKVQLGLIEPTEADRDRDSRR